MKILIKIHISKDCVFSHFRKKNQDLCCNINFDFQRTLQSRHATLAHRKLWRDQDRQLSCNKHHLWSYLPLFRANHLQGQFPRTGSRHLMVMSGSIRNKLFPLIPCLIIGWFKDHLCRFHSSMCLFFSVCLFDCLSV